MKNKGMIYVKFPGKTSRKILIQLLMKTNEN